MKILAAVLLMVSILLATPPSENSLPQPSVTLPGDWYLKSVSPYPTAGEGVHDPYGSGALTYEAKDNLSLVVIFYESSLNRTYSSDALVNDSVWLMTTALKLSVDNSSVMTVAGVPAGYASHHFSWNASEDVVVFVKGRYYFDVATTYMIGSAEQTEVWYILNSINVGASEAGGLALPVQAMIIGAIGGEVATVVVLAVLIAKTLRTEF